MNEEKINEQFSNSEVNKLCELKKESILSDLDIILEKTNKWPTINKHSQIIDDIYNESEDYDEYLKKVDEHYYRCQRVANEIRKARTYKNINSIALWVKVWSIFTIVSMIIYVILIMSN